MLKFGEFKISIFNLRIIYPRMVIMLNTRLLTHEATKYFLYITKVQMGFLIVNHHKCLRWLYQLHFDSYVMDLWPL